jgi:hypothetical protein
MEEVGFDLRKEDCFRDSEEQKEKRLPNMIGDMKEDCSRAEEQSGKTGW